MEDPARFRVRPFLGAARILLALLVLSLPLMKIAVPVAGYDAILTDGLFLLCASLAAIAFLRGELIPTWHRFFWVLAAYFAALTLSLLASDDPRASTLKLATQLYLVALPPLVFWLCDSERHLKRLLIAWLAATAVPALMGTATVILYYLGVDPKLLRWSLHGYGTLPPGHYPRLETTFGFAAMLCNYLTVGLFVLFYVRERGWISKGLTTALLAAIIITAAFTITPGLGGFVLALSVCVYWRAANRRVGSLILFGGLAAAILSVFAAAFTPIAHWTAPFALNLPAGVTLYAAVRLMTWMAAARVFLAHPLLGTGIGSAGLAVKYANPSGWLDIVTDAHNVYLSIAFQTGVVGVAALLALIASVAMTTWLYRSCTTTTALPLVLGVAWLDCFAVQGFTGSYEDARHLWVLVGIWLASVRFEAVSRGSSSSPRECAPSAASEAATG